MKRRSEGTSRKLNWCYPTLQLSEHIEGTAALTIFGHACRMGLEGILAERRNRPYRSFGSDSRMGEHQKPERARRVEAR